MTATAKQIGAIHGLKKKAGLDDENYRAMLRREAGVDSAKDLSFSSAWDVIERLKFLTGQKSNGNGHDTRSAKAPVAKGAMQLSGPYSAKLRALWISGYHLGVVQDRTDEALAAFVKRQTSIDHPTWIKNAFQATKVIEGLKAWIGREAGLDWPADGEDLHAVKVAIVNACWRRAIACGACVVLHDVEGDLAFYATKVTGRPNRTVNDIRVLTEVELDKVAAAIGARMRKHLAGGSR